MTFRLLFKEEAKKEWDHLDASVRNLFVKKLTKYIEQPCIESMRLNGMKACYKIKLRRIGYRLVYQVRDGALVISSVVIGKRERNHAYKAAIRKI
ncbi:MAG TPA: type II toxin-antitoxin system RelE/ParE family toxin [Gammaproteobacteria bacterium]|nr:type II toxin-antitoxin system RelE/ParE family toxin [Gammaproteobacteria bacterium]